MIQNELIDIIALIIFIVCILIYAVRLLYGIKKPCWGKRGFLNIIYGLWVKRMISTKETITAVQTMRNLIMIITFLSSSMLLLLGLLLQSPSIDLSATSTTIFSQYKLMLFVAVIVFSVTMFLLSLRQMVRFSILIGIPADSIKNISADYFSSNKTKIKRKDSCYLDAEKLKIDVFLRAMNRFTFGMRAVFYGIVITLWFVNAYTFIIGTISLTIFLVVHHDVEPCHHEELPI
jgi:uncharacterized membrane protein